MMMEQKKKIHLPRIRSTSKNCTGAAVLLGILYAVVWGSFFINVTLGLLNKQEEDNNGDRMRHSRGPERRSDVEFLAATGERRLGG